MRNFWRFHFIKVLLGIVALQLLFFFWLQKRNHRPVVADDVVTVYEGHTVKIKPLRNDTDKDEDEFVIQQVSTPLQGKIEQNENELIYTAKYGFAGVDSFTYTINDGKKDSKPGYLKITVEENLKPEIKNDRIEMYIGKKIPLAVLGNDNDREGDSIFITEFSDCLHGEIVQEGNELYYTPNVKSATVDSFHYKISDGNKTTEQASVTMIVKDKNDPLYPWLSMDIGGPANPGKFEKKGGDYIIDASGADIWDSQDHFHYAYQQIKGDFQMVTKVKSLEVTNEWAKAGIFVRETLNSNSKNALINITGQNGVSAQQRMNAGNSTQSQRQDGDLKAPYWLKMVRKGNNFSSYSSPDGVKWTEVSTVEVPMLENVYVGLAVTSHNDSEVCTAEFDAGKTKLIKK